MKLKNYFIMFWIILLLSAVINLVHGMFLQSEQSKIDAANLRYANIQKITDEMAYSSIWATRHVRSYVITGNQERLVWFNKIYDILNGSEAEPENYGPMYWDLLASGFQTEISENKSKGVSIE